MSTLTSKKSVTLADVALRAGISKTQASHALSGKGWVSPATREAVLKAAAEMGFRADPLARLLSNGRSETTIGFYTLDIDLSGRTRQLQNIQAELNDLGFNVPIYAYGYRGCGELKNQLELMRTLIAQRPRAIVCNTSGVRPEVFKELQNWVEEGGLLVCYGYSEIAPVGCDQVVQAESESYRIAARHLTALGHRDIGLFSVGRRRPNGQMLRAFEEALQEVGAKANEKWLFPNDGTRRYEEDGALLAQRFLKLRKKPSGMIISNDYAATAFISEVVRAGVLVPQQLSVVGHDDDAIAAYGVVPLTTVGIPIEAVSERVVELLTARLDGAQGAPQLEVLPGTLVHRQSTAPYIHHG
jgi:LacI family transcriptional regulator